jgi:hypothetical protein
MHLLVDAAGVLVLGWEPCADGNLHAASCLNSFAMVSVGLMALLG